MLFLYKGTIFIKGRRCQQRKSDVMNYVYDSISQSILSQNDLTQMDVACQNHMTLLYNNSWLQVLNIVTVLFSIEIISAFKTNTETKRYYTVQNKFNSCFCMCQFNHIRLSLSLYCVKIQAPITREGFPGKN